MDSKILHLHKTHRSSHENLLYLLIPILLFVGVLFFSVLKESSGKVSGVSTEAKTLTGSPQK